MQVVGSLLRRPARLCDPTSYAAATLVIFQTRRRRRRGWWELAGRQMLNQLVERKFFRCGRRRLLHGQEQRPACVRDTPLARLARDQLLAEDIEVWRPLSQTLHAGRPLGSAGVEYSQVLLDDVKAGPAIGLAGEYLEYRHLKAHGRHRYANY